MTVCIIGWVSVYEPTIPQNIYDKTKKRDEKSTRVSHFYLEVTGKQIIIYI